MADKWQAQDAFWNSFGMLAFDDQMVFTEGNEPQYPYITYESFGGVMDQGTTLSVNLWYESTAMNAMKQKADEILQYMKTHKTILAIDGGYVWLKVSETVPFARPFPTGSDDKNKKRILIQVEAECLTNA